MSNWRNMSAETVRAMGFTVDETCYPWVAYKGPRFAPTEWHGIATDREVYARRRRRTASKQASASQRVVVIKERQYLALNPVADALEELQARVAVLERELHPPSEPLTGRRGWTAEEANQKPDLGSSFG